MTVRDEQATVEAKGNQARSVRIASWKKPGAMRLQTSQDRQAERTLLLPGLFPVSPFHATLDATPDRGVRSPASGAKEGPESQAEGKAPGAYPRASQRDHGEIPVSRAGPSGWPEASKG